MTHRLLKWLVAGATLAVLAAFAAGGAFAGSAPVKPDVSAQFTTAGSVAPQFLSNATTVPHWTFQYTDPTNHVTYPITMAGGHPRNGGSTTIHTVIIPLKMNFVAAGQDTSALNTIAYPGYTAPPLNHTFDGGRRVNDVLNSPVFQNNTYPSDLGGDTGQLGDTYMRAQFDKIGSNYHVTLSNDKVFPTQILKVPSTKGIAYQRPVGPWREANGLGPTDTIVGVADSSWFSARLQQLMGSLQISATTVPIFVTDDVLLYPGQNNYANCCILGFHGAGMPVGHGAARPTARGSSRCKRSSTRPGRRRARTRASCPITRGPARRRRRPAVSPTSTL